MRAKFHVRNANLGDAVWFAPRLRAADRAEVEATAGPNIEAVLREVVAQSDMAWVATRDYMPVVLLGCAELEPGVGSPWLLATDEALRLGPSLTALAKDRVALVRKTWPRLVNYVDARNAVSIRWLARIGFEILPPVPYGVAGEPFHPFQMGA